MVYSADSAKWRAYQFLDPFAAGSFYVCNKINKYFCRPDCDAHPITELRLEIKFVPTVADAVDYGYVPCELCDPMLVPHIDVDMLIRTVKDINQSIGFVPPLMDEEDELINKTIKENIMENLHPQRRQLVPAISFNGKYSNFDRQQSTTVSKNDNEHYKLVDLACRHLALAAALSIFNTPSATNSPKLEDSSPDAYSSKKSRKRRGGVLGFKELAAKSKLSAWHFHRVFKSVTGLTPKTYGDKCYEHLQQQRDEAQELKPPSVVSQVSVPSSISSVDSIENMKSYSSPVLSTGSTVLPSRKRVRISEEEEYPSPKRVTKPLATPAMTPFNEFSGFEEEINGFGMDSRATSAPDLTAYLKPQSLFSHNKPIDFTTDMQFSMADMPLLMTMPQQEFMPVQPADIPFEESLGTFGGAGFSADLFAEDEIIPMHHELDITEGFNFGLLPELLTLSVGL